MRRKFRWHQATNGVRSTAAWKARTPKAPQLKREAVRRMLELTMLSERRAYRLAGLSRDPRHLPEPTVATQEL